MRETCTTSDDAKRVNKARVSKCHLCEPRPESQSIKNYFC